MRWRIASLVASVLLLLVATSTASAASAAAPSTSSTNLRGKTGRAPLVRVKPTNLAGAASGAGTFGTPTVYPVSQQGSTPYPQAVVVGDFDGDGIPDMAVALNGQGKIAILRGNGDGTFQTPTFFSSGGSSPYAMVAGDFNQDGKLDLAVADSGAGRIYVFLGNGDGTFQLPASYPSSPNFPNNPDGLAAGDLNGDGKLDLVVTNLISGDVDVLLGSANGTFLAPVPYATGTGCCDQSPLGVALGDFNNDGKLDVAVTNDLAAGTVTILLGNGDGTLGSPVHYGAGAQPVAVTVADFNGDGKLDLAVANNGNSGTPTPYGNVSVLLGNGDGTFQAAVAYNADANPNAIASADLNGDGKPDLVVSDGGSADISVLLNSGNGVFQTAANYLTVPPTTGANPVSVAIAKLGSNQAEDLAVANNVAGSVSVFLGTPPASVGGKDLRLTRETSGAIGLSWQTGTVQAGYAVLRFSSTGQSNLTPTPLAASATGFTDSSSLTGPFYCYLVVPLNGAGAGIGQSDLLCYLTGYQSASDAPTDFSIALDQSTTASFTWGAPATEFGYVLYAFPNGGPVTQTVLPSTATSATNTNTVQSCYILGAIAQNGTSLAGNTDALCGIPGFATVHPAAPTSLSEVQAQTGARVQQLRQTLQPAHSTTITAGAGRTPQ